MYDLDRSCQPASAAKRETERTYELLGAQNMDNWHSAHHNFGGDDMEDERLDLPSPAPSYTKPPSAPKLKSGD